MSEGEEGSSDTDRGGTVQRGVEPREGRSICETGKEHISKAREPQQIRNLAATLK
jgi:hypothetical protein